MLHNDVTQSCEPERYINSSAHDCRAQQYRGLWPLTHHNTMQESAFANDTGERIKRVVERYGLYDAPYLSDCIDAAIGHSGPLDRDMWLSVTKYQYLQFQMMQQSVNAAWHRLRELGGRSIEEFLPDNAAAWVLIPMVDVWELEKY